MCVCVCVCAHGLTFISFYFSWSQGLMFEFAFSPVLCFVPGIMSEFLCCCRVSFFVSSQSVLSQAVFFFFCEIFSVMLVLFSLYDPSVFSGVSQCCSFA